MKGKFNNDGIYFHSFRKIVQYFPTGLEKFYSNLNGIYITHGQLKEIHQRDLKFYSKLEFLDLFDNDIEVIEYDTFKFNLNLATISIHSNKIFHIGSEVFDGLGRLTSLALDLNKCTGMHAEKDSIQVQKILSHTNSTCIAFTYLTIEKKFSQLEGNLTISSDLRSRVENLESELKNSNLTFSSYFKERMLTLANLKLTILLHKIGNSGNKLDRPQDNSASSASSIIEKINKLENIFDSKKFTSTTNHNLIWMLVIACIISLIQIIIFFC